MKTKGYQYRFYRQWVAAQDLYRVCSAVMETDLQILSDKPVDKSYIEEKICFYRRQIEEYISKDNRFLNSLEPIDTESNAPSIIKEMGRAAKLAGVGPMAAVAGGIAQLLAQDLVASGIEEVIIENGGDIFLKICRPRKIGIYSGQKENIKELSLNISPEQTPLGVCSSSSKIGHSLSFGNADNVTVICPDAFAADAFATAICNRVKVKNDLEEVLNFARSFREIRGIVIVFENKIASWGDIEFAD